MEVNIHPRNGHEDTEEEYRYNYTLSLTSTLGGGGVFSVTPRPLYSPGTGSGTHLTGGWVGPRAGLEGAKNFAISGFRSSDCSARSQSLYRLSCSGPR